jgi:hypothetical protein
MPTTTYTPLANVTLAAIASSITFSNIPNTYGHLILVCRGRANTAVNLRLNYRFNGDATAGAYIPQLVRNEAATTFASLRTGAASGYLGELAAIDSAEYVWKLDIFDYAQTNKHKSLISRGGRAGSGNEIIASRWANTAAVTSVNVFSTSSVNFVIGSTFDLYGIVA